jgi:heavy metal efflux system protein
MLPKGYKVVPYYDRTQLVHTTLHTVLENLLLGMVLVFLVLIFFLGNLRTAIMARPPICFRSARSTSASSSIPPSS